MRWLWHSPYSKIQILDSGVFPIPAWPLCRTSFSSRNLNSSRAVWLETLNCSLIWASEWLVCVPCNQLPTWLLHFPPSHSVTSETDWLKLGCCSQKIKDGCDNNSKNHPCPYFWFNKPVICFYQERDPLKHQPLCSCCPLTLTGYTGSLAVGKQSLQRLWGWPCHDSFSGRVWKQSGKRGE